MTQKIRFTSYLWRKQKAARWDEQLNRNDGGKKFETVLLGSIDEAFSTLGERAKTSIYLTWSINSQFQSKIFRTG